MSDVDNSKTRIDELHKRVERLEDTVKSLENTVNSAKYMAAAVALAATLVTAFLATKTIPDAVDTAIAARIDSETISRLGTLRIVREKSVRYLFPRSGPSGALQKTYRTLIFRSLLKEDLLAIEKAKNSFQVHGENHFVVGELCFCWGKKGMEGTGQATRNVKIDFPKKFAGKPYVIQGERI